MIQSPYYSNTAFNALTPLAVVYSLAAHLWAFVRHGNNAPIALLPTPQPSFRQKVAIVTGSNTGIGYETARSLAVDYGMTVVVACRSRQKGEQAVEQIQREGGSGAVFVHALDLSSSQSIVEFSAAVQTKFDKIHILVNNAGRNSISPDPVPSEDSTTNRDVLFQTNFLGHFELTAQLMNILAPNARVVNLASVMHHFIEEGNVNDVSYWKGCITHNEFPTSTYQPSKLAAVLFTLELNKRYSDRIQSVAVNPGGVNSDIWRNFPRFIIPFFALVYLNNRQGCQTSVAGAVCDFDQVQLEAHSNVAYLQPYHQYIIGAKCLDDKPMFPLFEMLGVFAGHVKARPRLPTHDGGLQAAESLWQACMDATNAQWPEPKKCT